MRVVEAKKERRAYSDLGVLLVDDETSKGQMSCKSSKVTSMRCESTLSKVK